MTKKGGRIVAKDFDGGVLIFEPMDPDLSLQVLAAVARSLKERPTDPPFDNFVGRKLHGIFVRAGFDDVVTESYAINKVAPLKPEAKRYLSATPRGMRRRQLRTYPKMFFGDGGNTSSRVPISTSSTGKTSISA